MRSLITLHVLTPALVTMFRGLFVHVSGGGVLQGMGSLWRLV